MTLNGQISHWWHDLGGRPAARESLRGRRDADVCIVGAGYTGLWTAFYLKQIQPTLDVVIVEREFAGYGASGRNGGWLTAALPGSARVLARNGGPAAVTDLQVQLQEQVDEVIEVCAQHGIDADIVKGGELRVATDTPQLQRMRESWDPADAADEQWLDADQLAERVRIDGAQAAVWSPHCARLHPAKLVRGLAELVEQQGVSILEGSVVETIERGRVVTAHGEVHAPIVLRCTEGFTATIAGEHRTWLPMNSSMIVTAPLPDPVWDEIGWSGAEVIGDEAHVYMYAQRTADDRIAIGGRGVPYRFGSRVDAAGATAPRTVDELSATLHRLWPATRGTAIDHAWSGVLGVPRDWSATVTFDQATGAGFAGGYVGHGVVSSSLAGRTLADLSLGRETRHTALPWVNRKVHKWEPEPLRWLGVRGLYAAYRFADKRESGTGRTSRIARAADVISRKP
ncbi:NAD(P)/FAD-dependent oxidoreductase [Rudaeicoccus suwonensis]|uniref:Glycine/D-amino acid oxidase-like deaminating enzyme n=1 Tax=Rudaeicoccus suwonensis TaxID=657409 RepID=A0A561E3L1_9MICO|nr:FAD-dependent oxidoreductase [Rudaeicoccus suwonensis]TWE10205.1 glycine/D-amino acid oxidase-like deaminating enzyme [Rudaeicoccus suwonensis]